MEIMPTFKLEGINGDRRIDVWELYLKMLSGVTEGIPLSVTGYVEKLNSLLGPTYPATIRMYEILFIRELIAIAHAPDVHTAGKDYCNENRMMYRIIRDYQLREVD
jgi:hypothetical protein